MRTLLIVDDEPLALRALSRLFRGMFEATLLAETAEEAEAHLAANEVTHLLCDHHLGAPRPGTELVVRWRGSFPSIVFAAVMTGDDVDAMRAIDGVDAYFSKPFDVKALRAAFSE